jgi:hypothetical protein
VMVVEIFNDEALLLIHDQQDLLHGRVTVRRIVD